MINLDYLKYRKYHYLDGDETLIENYDKAIADKTQTWVCHHRRELEPDVKTAEDLKSLDLYWNRPPEELIFLTNTDHWKLHSCGKNNPMFGKSSWEKHTPEERADRKRRYIRSMKGKNLGKTFWTDGKVKIFSRECPEGFHKLAMFRITDGVNYKIWDELKEIPCGWHRYERKGI